ncbi:MAG: hypothetical protein KTR21_14810 [Rhodobacteraceae bacterium]|nr:hypothetical protein [Paracoccaceae bacterium]
MWTYTTISLVVMIGMLLSGGFGFFAGWMMRRALIEEREAGAGDLEDVYAPPPVPPRAGRR